MSFCVVKFNYPRLIHNACTKKGDNEIPKFLYDNFRTCLEDFLQTVIFTKLKDLEDNDLLRELTSLWQSYQGFFVRPLWKCLQFLDRHYVPMNQLPTLNFVSVSDFNNIVFTRLAANIQNAFLKNLARDRDGQQVDRDCLRKTTEITIAVGSKPKPRQIFTRYHSSFSAKCKEEENKSGNNLTNNRDLLNLEVYESVLERPILLATESYYSVKSKEWLSSLSVGSYLERVDNALKEENRRVHSFLDSSSLPALRAVVIDALLAHPLNEILTSDTSIKFMISNDLKSQIDLIFRMCSLVEGGVQPLAQTFKHYVECESAKLIDAKTTSGLAAKDAKTTEEDKESNKTGFIESVLDLHDRFKCIVVQCTANDSYFQLALKQAMMDSLNKVDGGSSDDAVSFSQLLAKYVDSLLKKGGDANNSNEQWLSTQLTRVVDIFSYVIDKDVFGEAHRSLLSKRLLNDTTLGEESEKTFVSMLKTKCGAQFTTKFEGMLNDLTSAKKTLIDFHSHIEAIRECHKNSSVVHSSSEAERSLATNQLVDDFSVQVLTTGYWPSHTLLSLNLPVSVQSSIDAFTKYYERQNARRLLQYVHSLGNAIVRGRFNDRTFEFLCTPTQAVMLLLFNSPEADTVGLDIKGIANLMGFGTDDAAISLSKKILATLCFAKATRLLKKATEEKVIKATIVLDDKFIVNSNFSSSNRRMKLPAPSFADKESLKSHGNVEEDRSQMIDAAIVRIMKSRRVLGHTDLMNEVLQHLTFFKPTTKSIKLRIDSLIEREYMERDANNAANFVYIA